MVEVSTAVLSSLDSLKSKIKEAEKYLKRFPNSHTVSVEVDPAVVSEARYHTELTMFGGQLCSYNVQHDDLEPLIGMKNPDKKLKYARKIPDLIRLVEQSQDDYADKVDSVTDQVEQLLAEAKGRAYKPIKDIWHGIVDGSLLADIRKDGYEPATVVDDGPAEFDTHEDGIRVSGISLICEPTTREDDGPNRRKPKACKATTPTCEISLGTSEGAARHKLEPFHVSVVDDELIRFSIGNARKGYPAYIWLQRDQAREIAKQTMAAVRTANALKEQSK